MSGKDGGINKAEPRALTERERYALVRGVLGGWVPGQTTPFRDEQAPDGTVYAKVLVRVTPENAEAYRARALEAMDKLEASSGPGASTTTEERAA